VNIARITDAWEPQVNGVVITLRELVREPTLLVWSGLVWSGHV
jgi:aryl carrier-like protein